MRSDGEVGAAAFVRPDGGALRKVLSTYKVTPLESRRASSRGRELRLRRRPGLLVANVPEGAAQREAADVAVARRGEPHDAVDVDDLASCRLLTRAGPNSGFQQRHACMGPSSTCGRRALMRAPSLGSVGLWSTERHTALPPLQSTARESPKLPITRCEPRSSAVTAVHPSSHLPRWACAQTSSSHEANAPVRTRVERATRWQPSCLAARRARGWRLCDGSCDGSGGFGIPEGTYVASPPRARPRPRPRWLQRRWTRSRRRRPTIRAARPARPRGDRPLETRPRQLTSLLAS